MRGAVNSASSVIEWFSRNRPSCQSDEQREGERRAHGAAHVNQQRRDSEFDQPEKEFGPMKRQFTEEQIIGFLREADAGLPVIELCRKHGFSEATCYAWQAKFGGMRVSDAQRLRT